MACPGGAFRERNQLALIGFDPATGQFAAPRPLDVVGRENQASFFTNASFSPDNSKLYITQMPRDLLDQAFPAPLVQYDLRAADVRGSRVLLYPEGFSPLDGLAFQTELQLGPDGRIYGVYNWGPPAITQRNGMFVIGQPNRVGADCQFRVQFFEGMAGSPRRFLPTLIEGVFRDRVPPEDPCDPSDLVLAPNPTARFVRLVTPGCPVTVEGVVIWDAAGRRVRDLAFPEGQFTSLDLQGLASGLYVLQLQTSAGPVVRRIALQQ